MIDEPTTTADLLLAWRLAGERYRQAEQEAPEPIRQDGPREQS